MSIGMWVSLQRGRQKQAISQCVTASEVTVWCSTLRCCCKFYICSRAQYINWYNAEHLISSFMVEELMIYGLVISQTAKPITSKVTLSQSVMSLWQQRSLFKFQDVLRRCVKQKSHFLKEFISELHVWHTFFYCTAEYIYLHSKRMY